jgi:hypothetical protein
MRPRVSILTYCRNPELLYGSTLVFKTLRVGFPSALVTVTDNCSVPSARGEIEALAKESDCRFQALSDRPVAHDRFIQDALRAAAEDPDCDGPLVILDPDLCLWRSCEHFRFDGLIAGKFMGPFYDSRTETRTQPRLHTSFLWIPDPKRLWAEILRIKHLRFDFEPFLPCSVRLEGSWVRFDTGASLYAALPDACSRFAREHLDCYDHIYAGSHLDWVAPGMDEGCRRMLEQVHQVARAGDLDALRGIWRYQDAVFRRSTGGSIPLREEESR